MLFQLTRQIHLINSLLHCTRQSFVKVKSNSTATPLLLPLHTGSKYKFSEGRRREREQQKMRRRERDQDAPLYRSRVTILLFLSLAFSFSVFTRSLQILLIPVRTTHISDFDGYTTHSLLSPQCTISECICTSKFSLLRYTRLDGRFPTIFLLILSLSLYLFSSACHRCFTSVCHSSACFLDELSNAKSVVERKEEREKTKKKPKFPVDRNTCSSHESSFNCHLCFVRK